MFAHIRLQKANRNRSLETSLLLGILLIIKLIALCVTSIFINIKHQLLLIFDIKLNSIKQANVKLVICHIKSLEIEIILENYLR